MKNYITAIQNSIGSQLFRTFYVDNVDVLKNGDLSCAYYVSTILLMFGFIDRPHFRVDGTIVAMEKSGWFKILKPKVGCVVIWDAVSQNDTSHLHIGFYVGGQQAISNRSSIGMPGEHALHYSGLDKDQHKKIAPVIAYYWHKRLIEV